ncbi:hypothetical protein CAPTEDRAFT_176002 [Capitella teleta]|uniref:Uncharacterized protein n=1 Tax=Capitella teleta TaxID=283909 RepID=R7TIP4_CAPTE|nr:hypothetical protein CAPTEDRAFT_176002 [Capitella teleta]|eukprot:ELT93327.1 hypothetical protein CAPTEDRAFT_176002 [Capitella teleta]
MVCPGRVTAAAVSPDGNYFVAAVAEKIHVWQICTGHLLAVVSRHYQPVSVLRFTDDGSHFVSGGEDNLVLVWPMPKVLNPKLAGHTGQGATPRHTWSHHSLAITDVHVGTGGIRSRVVTASLDGTVKLLELASGQLLCSFVFDCEVTSIIMDAPEQNMYAGLVNGHVCQVRLYEEISQPEHHVTSSGTSPALFKGHVKKVLCLAISLDGSILVSGSQDTDVRMWDIHSKQCIRTLSHKGPIANLMLTVAPPALGAVGDALPLPPIQHFQRHLLSDAESVGEGSKRRTFSVRLTKRQVPETKVDLLMEDVFEEMGSSDKGEEMAEEVEESSSYKFQELKAANKKLYNYALTEILQLNNS